MEPKEKEVAIGLELLEESGEIASSLGMILVTIATYIATKVHHT